jgi:sec-independent protein translocase protein TatC
VSKREGDGQLSDVQMPFTSHLAELRSRLLKSVLAVAVVFFACFGFADDIFAVLTAPLRRLNIRGLQLIGTAVTEAFFTKMKVSFVAAVILSSPILLWQFWQFIAPGLYEHEKRYTRSFVSVGSVFFVAGAAFCYFIVIQRGLSFLLTRYEEIDIQPLLQIGDYLSLVSRLVLAFGTMFEMPVLAFFLARVGIIDHRLLIRHSRYALIAIALFAAVLTPPDLIAQIFMMLPLMLLYALSIAVAYLARYRMNRLERRME